MTLAEALAALDRAVTSASHSRAYLTQEAQPWVTREEYALERFASGLETYTLSDHESRVSYSVAYGWCALANGASNEARNNFEMALDERRAVEAIVATWFDGKRAEGK